MRNEIVHIGAGELNYEIRNIMKVVEKVRAERKVLGARFWKEEQEGEQWDI